MKSVNDIRIGSKLSLAFLSMLIFAGVIGGGGVIQLSRVARDADLIATEALASVYRVSSIGTNAAQSRAAALEVLTQLQLNYTGGADGALRTRCGRDGNARQRRRVSAIDPDDRATRTLGRCKRALGRLRARARPGLSL